MKLFSVDQQNARDLEAAISPMWSRCLICKEAMAQIIITAKAYSHTR